MIAETTRRKRHGGPEEEAATAEDSEDGKDEDDLKEIGGQMFTEHPTRLLMDKSFRHTHRMHESEPSTLPSQSRSPSRTE